MGTPQDICVTEAHVLPTQIISFPAGEGPSGTLSAFAASTLKRWAFKKAREAVIPLVTLFPDNASIEKYVHELCKPPLYHHFS